MGCIKALLLIPLALQFVKTTSAQRSGVLLGVADAITSESDDFSTIHPPTYRTLWIAPDANGELKVLATLPGLIVPRKDGFWHVGISQQCASDDSIKDFPNESLSQEVWAAPIGKTSPIGQSQPCPLHKPEDYAPAYGRSEEEKGKISQCGFALASVHYLSPEVIGISIEEGSSEACEAGRGGRITKKYSVRNFDYRAIGFGQLLGQAAHDAYFNAVPKHGTNSFGTECADTPNDDDTGWRVEHKGGSWHPYVNQSLGYFECAADGPIHFQLPASMTGDLSTPLDWKLLRSRISSISDAYVSPNGDLVIAITKSEMRFFEARKSMPGKLLLKLPAGEIVMAQWATGTHVQDWTTELSKLAKQSLREPIVRIRPE